MTWQPTEFVSGENSLWQYFDANYFLAATVILLVTVWYLTKIKEWYRDRMRLIHLASKLPGPPTLPIIGNALKFIGPAEETLNLMRDIMEGQITPGRFWLGPKLFIVLTEPRDYEVILGSQKASYKDSIYRFIEPFVGKGLVSGSGPTHRLHRKTIMPMLNSKALNLYLEYFNTHSAICSELLNQKVRTGPFDIQPFLVHCTFDMIFETILGMPADAQKGGHKELVYWTETMYNLVHTRMIKIWFHPDWIFSLSNLSKKQKEGQNVIRSFVESAIVRKRKEHQALERGSISSDRPRLTLLEQLIDHLTKSNIMNDVELRDEVYTVFTAAQDTTGVISSFALLHLAMDQEIQDKVREEIKRVVGEDNVKVEHLPDLKYTEMVIKETLRLYPIAPAMVRQATGDIDLETCTLPKGGSILMLPFITHRSTDHWSDPEKFIPERFLPENSNERHSFAYIPFSGGIRGCIGQKFALICLKTIIVHIVRKFRLTTTQKLESLRLKMDISVRSRDGYMVSLSKI